MRGFALLLVLVPGCVIPGETRWFTTPAITQPTDKIMQTMNDVLTSNQFKVERRDDVAGVIESEWRARLRPEWKEGIRERVEMQVVPLGAGAYAVKVRALREINDNSRDPMSASSASWIGAEGNDGLSERLVYLLRIKLIGLKMDE